MESRNFLLGTESQRGPVILRWKSVIPSRDCGMKEQISRRSLERSGAPPATIGRELHRNRTGGEYYAAQAQRQSEHRRSIPFDNGTEFARCHRLEKPFDLKQYFADPGCPDQRGTNENTNGLIRRYFPKGDQLSRRLPWPGA